MEVLGYCASQHQFVMTEKGRRKVGWPLGVNCYSLLLHTLLWTVEENIRLGEVIVRPHFSPVRVCLQGVLIERLAKAIHQDVWHADEMASYHPS